MIKILSSKQLLYAIFSEIFFAFSYIKVLNLSISFNVFIYSMHYYPSNYSYHLEPNIFYTFSKYLSNLILIYDYQIIKAAN